MFSSPCFSGGFNATRTNSRRVVLSILIMGCFLFGYSALAAGQIEYQCLGPFPGTHVEAPDEQLDWIHELKVELSESKKKLSTDLLQVIDCRFLPQSTSPEAHLSSLEALGQFRPAETYFEPETRVNEGAVYVYTYLKFGISTGIIDQVAVEVTDRDELNHYAAAWVKVSDISSLASLEAVRAIRMVMPPVFHTGSVTTLGDAIHRTEDVRNTYGEDGTGINVGAISDGVDSRASAQATGDLPPDGAGLTVLSNTVGGDEGTALLEVIHDMAPGAGLYFHDPGINTIAFNAAIDNLVTAGCDVICDDVGWLTQPFFEHGSIASHVMTVLSTENVIHTTAAGNAGQTHYQGDYYDIDGPGGSTQHDFSHGTGAPYLYLNMASGNSVRIVLEWNDPFGSSSNDYLLALYSWDQGDYVAVSDIAQDGDDDPLEFIAYTATSSGASNDYSIVVQKNGAAAIRILEVFFYPVGGGVYSNNISPVDAIFGHAAVDDMIAVGAVSARDPGNDDIEPYSSQGPATFGFYTLGGYEEPMGGGDGWAGVPSARDTYTETVMDVVATDCISITGAGGFGQEDPPGSGNYIFPGTSGSVPHTAAIVAQWWGANPTESSSTVRTLVITVTAGADLGAPGYDNVYGYGRTDAWNCYHQFRTIDLWGSVVGGDLLLQWESWPGVTAYWVFGEANNSYFDPTTRNRLDVLPSGTTTWSSPLGIGDPNNNWTYIIMAVDSSDQEILRSGPFGEHDFVTP